MFFRKTNLDLHKEAMGLKISYSVIILDIVLIVVRMFNKNAAEACLTINDAIWGSLTDLINGIGDAVGQIPYIGSALESFVSVFSTITDSIESLLNILPMALYNFWEILFWVFIIMTACTAIPVILGKYYVERQYIQARIDQRCQTIRENASENNETALSKNGTVIMIENQYQSVEDYKEQDTAKEELHENMEVF